MGNKRLLIEATKMIYRVIQNIEIVSANYQIFGKSPKEIYTILAQLEKPHVKLRNMIKN